jgi:hypothetical protein
LKRKKAVLFWKKEPKNFCFMGALAMLLPKSTGQGFFAAARGGLLFVHKKKCFLPFPIRL